MATIRHAPAIGALVLGACLAASLASAQSPTPVDPGAKAPRSVTGTGQTKPPGGAGGTAAASLPKPATEAAMIKAQKAAEARSKAWDTKMRSTMGSICSGC